MQIKGEYKSVQNAMFQVTDRLRDNLLPKEMFKEVKAQFPYVGVSEDPWRNDHIPHKVGALSLPQRLQLPHVKIHVAVIAFSICFKSIKFTSRASAFGVDYNCRLGEKEKPHQSQIQKEP